MMREVEVLVIGAGPAGLEAAITASSMGASVLLIDRQNTLGGQLIKQTHMFFGSKEEHASVRGIEIGEILSKEVEESENITTFLKTTALGYYPDGVVALERERRKRGVSTHQTQGHHCGYRCSREVFSLSRCRSPWYLWSRSCTDPYECAWCSSW